MSRLANTERELDLCSVVSYVGEGVGARGTGQHNVPGPDDTVSLSWQYKVVRLWQVPSQELLALNRPGLLPLLGLTRLDKPDEIVPKVVDSLKQIADAELQGRLFTSLMSLLDDEGVIEMIEKIVESDELVIDSPYIRRIKDESRKEGHDEGHKEGIEEGRKEGRKEGHDEGHEEGREEGELSMLRRNILNGIVLRFDPTVSLYQQIENDLATLNSLTRLDELFEKIFQVNEVQEFNSFLNGKLAEKAAEREQNDKQKDIQDEEQDSP
ncbi:MAG: hypothetical protein AAF702_30285 [Chloroflexota bacterium]